MRPNVTYIADREDCLVIAHAIMQYLGPCCLTDECSPSPDMVWTKVASVEDFQELLYEDGGYLTVPMLCERARRQTHVGRGYPLDRESVAILEVSPARNLDAETALIGRLYLYEGGGELSMNFARLLRKLRRASRRLVVERQIRVFPSAEVHIRWMKLFPDYSPSPVA